MYNIANFTPWESSHAPPLRKNLGAAVCLVGSKSGGYQFMSVLDRAKAVADNLDFKIVGVEK